MDLFARIFNNKLFKFVSPVPHEDDIKFQQVKPMMSELLHLPRPFKACLHGQNPFFLSLEITHHLNTTLSEGQGFGLFRAMSPGNCGDGTTDPRVNVP